MRPSQLFFRRLARPRSSPSPPRAVLGRERTGSTRRDCTVIGLGRYDHSHVFGLANDSISSLILGTGTSARFCSDANGGGRCQTFSTGSVVSFTGTHVGNDSISSIYVQ